MSPARPAHPLARLGVDNKQLSRGTGGREPPRNTLGIYNTAGLLRAALGRPAHRAPEQAQEVMLSPRVPWP